MALRVRQRWVERLARAGFAVKGVLYLVLGGSAFAFALRLGGRVTNLRGEIAWLLDAPGGRVLVGSIAVGLGLYAAWRFLEAFADANRKGSGLKAMTSRARYAGSGAIYGVLAFDAARLTLAVPESDRGFELPATISGSVLGEGLATLVAIGIGAYGLLQVVRAFSARLSDQLHAKRVERHAGRAVVLISRAGIAGRGVALMLMGVVLFRRAASLADAAATDAADSMRFVAGFPGGRPLLAAVAAGFVAYGVYQIVQARYRTITPP